MTAAASAPRRQLPLRLLSEIALGGLTAAAVFGMRRLLAGSDWFLPLLLQVALAHVAAAVMRRANVPLVVAFPMVLLVGFYVASVIYVPDAMAGRVIPTGDVFGAVRLDLDVAWTAFADVRAPTEALEGFLIASSMAIWLTAGLADWAAFRIDAPFEATLPSSTIFVLVAILGTSAGRAVSTAVWLGAALVFLLFRRAERLGRNATWVGELRHRGPATLVGVGVAIAVTALTLASVVGPRLPGAESDAIVSLKDIGRDDGPGSRVTVSPLVDIRSRLVNQRDVEVFRVTSDERSYWRLTSLDRFDGRIWSSNGSFGRESGTLPEGIATPPDNVTFDQEYEVSALSQIWLPAAYEPTAISTRTDVRYDETSGTLIVDTDVPTSNGMRYVVRSALPVFDPVALAGASRVIPAEIAEKYLDLPTDFPSTVVQVATEVTAGAGSVYEAMLRLQAFFRDNFTYNLAVGPGHDDNALEAFVTSTREGYCEQFAGAFAAMARSLGVPARVAVGFTPGDQSTVDPTQFSVRGEHAHAWPEVYMGEFGWVAFEPTPGRGAPFAENYTGVPEQQAASGDPNVATTVPATSTSVAPQPGGPSAPSTSAFGDVDLPDLGDIDQATGAAASDRGFGWLATVAKAAIVAVVLVAVYLVVVPTALLVRRRRRRHRATTTSAQVGVAWDESIEAIEDAGVLVSPGVTHREVARQLERALPGAAAPMAALAATVEATTFSPEAPDETSGTIALGLADEVRRAATDSVPGRQRLREQYLPAKLRARQRRRRDRPRA